MAAMGFTINTLTLFAIVLAIGIVVDDAIVVVEGAAKHIERGKSPHDSAIAAMNELFGPIVAVTLVLMSVFLPAAFLPGIIGQMYRQFALVIAVHRAHQRLQRDDTQAHAMRALAATARSEQKAERLLPGLQRRLCAARALVCRPHRSHGPPQRTDDAPCRRPRHALAHRPRPHAHGLFAHRGSGLRDDRRAIARRRRDCPLAGRHAKARRRDPLRARRRGNHRHRRQRRLAHRRKRVALQLGRDLRRAEAGQGTWPRRGHPDGPQRHPPGGEHGAGGELPRDAAAADPGPRHFPTDSRCRSN